MAVLAPSLKLNSGYEMPVLGLGTFQEDRKGAVKAAVIAAIEAGYRHIDTAYIYENEKEVGAGIKAKIDDGTVKREDLFVVTKLWDTAHHPDYVIPGIKRSLELLGLDYVDLYLIHWPLALKPSDDLFPKDSEGNPDLDTETDLVDTWKKMEELVGLGLARSIGISNFTKAQIERVLAKASITPAVHQIEVHPYFPNNKMVDLCKKLGIVVTAYSPFGAPAQTAPRPEDPRLLEDPKLIEIGKKYGKGPNHVILKWLIQRDLITIPKSFSKNRIIDNFDVFEFTLTDEDMKEIATLDKGPKGRGNLELFLKHAKEYPFNDEF